VPSELVGVPFRAIEAIDAGLVTARQLQSSAWARVARGIYVSREHADTPDVRLQTLRLVLGDDPSAVVCGQTAAWIYGADDPRRGDSPAIEITRPVRAPGSTTTGVGRRRLTLRGTPDCVVPATGLSEVDQDVIEVDGLRITSPLRTCFDLMRTRHLVEAVAVADAFAYRTGLPLGLLDAYCSSRHRWPQVRLARQAVTLASRYSRSPGETRLRMVVVLSGFDEPLVNVPVTELGSGRVIGIPDLTVLGRGGRLVGLEYDGEYHRQEEQRDRDRLRENRLASLAGIPLLRYDADSIRRHRPLIVSQIEDLTQQQSRTPLRDTDFRRS